MGRSSPIWPDCEGYWSQWGSLKFQDGKKKERKQECGDSEKQRLGGIARAACRRIGRAPGGKKIRGRFGMDYTKNDADTVATFVYPEMAPIMGKRRRQFGSSFEIIAIDIAGPFPETDSGNKNTFW